MIRLSILYPAGESSRFDIDYYLNTHMPESDCRLSAGDGFRGVSVERGLMGQTPGSDRRSLRHAIIFSNLSMRSWRHSCHTLRFFRAICLTIPILNRSSIQSEIGNNNV